MIWMILLFAIAIILIRFFVSYDRDNFDLEKLDIGTKFEVLISILNEYAFGGKGSVTTIDKREINLYKESENQIIKLQYGTGHLYLTWKYKYLQKEVIYSRQHKNARNLSIIEQQNIAEKTINEMKLMIEDHKKLVHSAI